MLFSLMWFHLIRKHHIHPDGLIAIGFCGFVELCFELGIFANWLLK